jgi:hypothetical protein
MFIITEKIVCGKLVTESMYAFDNVNNHNSNIKF